MNGIVFRRWLAVAVLMAAVALVGQARGQFARLDSLIAVQPHIVAEKETRLAQMKADLAAEPTVLGRYGIMRRLYEEYAAYQYDSAYAYVSQCIRLAQEMGDAARLNESRLNLAHILSTACLMEQARQMLAQIDTAQLTPEQARQMLAQIDTAQLTPDQFITYYRTRTDLLIYQAEYMQGTRYADEAVQQLIAVRQRVAALDGPKDNVSYLITRAECLADGGNQQQAIDLLATLLPRYKSGDRMYSIITSTMSFHYSQLDDRDKQMEYLIKSAESDLEGCIRENTSLRAIADRLFDEGDIDRAYRYMRVAVDDANFYGTRLRNIQSSRIVPKILSAYQTKQEQSSRKMKWLLGLMSLIALLMVVGVVAIYQLLKRYRRLNEQKKAINEQLRQVNGQLHESNALLQEREKLKEEYIARFLALSSRFIDRGEEQRKALYRLYRDRKTEELARELKSTGFGNENAQLFYENFDNAFLNIFPNFVDEVNKLLQEGGKIEVKQGKRLTTESRVLALIRIGITDNQSIANILRASLTTIYTYRSKLKARALDKDSFETQVKGIDG